MLDEEKKKLKQKIKIFILFLTLILIIGCIGEPQKSTSTPTSTPIKMPTETPKPSPIKTALPIPTSTPKPNINFNWGYWTADNKVMKVWGTLENLDDETIRNIRVSASLENCGNAQSQSFDLLRWQKKEFILYIDIPPHSSDLKSRIIIKIIGDNLIPIQESSDWFILTPIFETPTPITIPITTRTTPPQQDVWNFITYCQHNWVYEYDLPNEPCQSPQVSYQRLMGDCDDFAVMMAYYLQEIYGYDTVIVIIQHWSGAPHAVCFVAASQEVAQSLANRCGGIPTLRLSGRTYVAVDWQICPDWTWTQTGGSITVYEWADLVGKPI